ncbi:MAG: branched-chain amino acid ABC transporter permease [Burkholderiales bacterium]|nr:branched-chain amino acid ABC transporter permease [Burkholderiales bacterium]
MSVRWKGLLGLAVLLAVLPWLLPNTYVLDVVNRIGINAIAVIGLNLVMGYAGQVSLGHAGFFGLGAYASAILTSRYGWPPLVAMGAGMAGTGLLAFAVARPILRLKGHYLAMATLGLGIIVSIVITNESAWTGGPDGMPVDALAVAGVAPSGEFQWYWLIATCLWVAAWLAGNLVDSPVGRALRALHGSEAAAQSVGVDIARYKARVFTISAVFASFAGSLFAHYVGFITPQVASFLHSIELVTMVVVGGMASVYGSVFGAALLTTLPQLLAEFEGWEMVVFGALLILVMVLLPRGLVPTVLRRWRGA